MQTSTSNQIRDTVRQAYGAIATGRQTSCCSGSGCCGAGESPSRELGYSADDMANVPEGADLGLGCGNPRRSPPSSPASGCWISGAVQDSMRFWLRVRSARAAR